MSLERSSLSWTTALFVATLALVHLVLKSSVDALRDKQTRFDVLHYLNYALLECCTSFGKEMMDLLLCTFLKGLIQFFVVRQILELFSLFLAMIISNSTNHPTKSGHEGLKRSPGAWYFVVFRFFR